MRTLLLGLILVLAFSQVSFAQSQGNYKYDVSDYKAIFYLPNKGADIKVELNINYEIGDEVKADGFKFVGKNEVSDVSCVTESHDKCTVEIEHLKETKIIWRFAPARNASKAVKVSFIIKNQLRKEGKAYSFSAPWTGIFRVPVQKATYEVLFPQGVVPNIVKVTPESYEKNCSHGTCSLTVTQTPLVNRELAVKYQE